MLVILYDRETMRSVVLLCLVVATAFAGPPLGLSEDSLSPLCRTPECPATIVNPDSPITLPYPMDCLQYIVCEESGPRKVACPPDLVYNKVRSFPELSQAKATFYCTIISMQTHLKLILFKLYWNAINNS